MKLSRKINRFVQALIFRKKMDADMTEEMRVHIELSTQSKIDSGGSPEEARYAAMKRFGRIESLKEFCREQRGMGWLDDFLRDVQYGARHLRKHPGFSLVAVLTLALGIGTCTGIFILINATLLRALPFPDADRLVVIWATNPSLKMGLPALPPANSDTLVWREQHTTFGSLAAFTPRTADLAGSGEPERVGAVGISDGFFETLGAAPLLGRTLTAGEELPGGPPVAVIGYALWQRRFAGDPLIIGKGISVNGETRTVVGVMPPEFDFPRSAEWPAFFPFPARTELWLPLGFGAQDWADRGQRALAVIGRLKPEISIKTAREEMAVFASREAASHPETHQGWNLNLVSLRDQLTGKSRSSLLILFASVGLLLLIACVNVASLVLARESARRQEIAVRAALGASRCRLVRQTLVESLLLAIAGGGLGLFVAKGCLTLFLILNPATYSRLDEASIDPAVLAFTALIILSSCVVFGLLPGLATARLDLRTSLQDGGRGLHGVHLGRLRGGFVAAEVSLAIILLTTAGLLVRSFLQVEAVETGFRSDSVLAFDLQLPDSRYPNDADKVLFFKRLNTRLESMPGVRAAGAISYLPLGGGENLGSFQIEGETPAVSAYERGAERRWITPGYFTAMAIPLRQGRFFESTDTSSQPLVVLINECMARQFFGERSPIGRRLKVGQSQSASWRTIVGVVSDVKSSTLESSIRPQLYLPNTQWTWASMTFVVKTERDPWLYLTSVRNEVKSLDAFLPLGKVRTMEQVVRKAAGSRRLNMALSAFFATAALLLTTIGIYGMVSFLASHRRREIGVRLALGAQQGGVRWLVIKQAMRPVIVGSLLGLAGSVAAGRVVATQLYGVSPWAPWTVATMTGVILVAALVACWLPARQASLADPLEALRME